MRLRCVASHPAKLISLDWLSLAEQAGDKAFKLHHSTRKGLVSFFQKAAEYPDPLIPGGLELAKARNYLEKCPQGEHPVTQALNWLVEGLQPDPEIKSSADQTCLWLGSSAPASAMSTSGHHGV